MNKNDFYKELMTQYALDPEKIRINALKQAKKPAWQKAVGAYWKPALGAAAAVAVTVAGVGLANNTSAPDITLEPNDVLSASQRLMEAEQNYYDIDVNQDFSNVYVTFMEPQSYNEILMVLSTVTDSGDFELGILYLEDDTVRGSTAISEYAAAYSGEKTVVAAKISLPASYYRDIQDLSSVYLAELGSAEINDSTFTPMVVEDEDPLQGDSLDILPPVTEATVVTTTPFSFNTVTEIEEVKPVIGESHSSDISTMEPPSYEEEEIPVDVEDSEPEESEAPEESATETTTAPAVTTPEETTTTYYRGDVGLLTQIYELNVKNALEAHVAGNNVLVLTKDEAYLYTLSGFTANQSSQTIGISSPKIAYQGDDSIILTGCRPDGTRGMISVINLETDAVYTYDAGANIGGYEIGGIKFSDEGGKYFMKAVSAESTLIYELSVNGEIAFRPLVEIEAPVSLAGYGNGKLYFTFLENGAWTRLYSFDTVTGNMDEIKAFSGKIKLRRGEDFSSFAITSTDEAATYIFDVTTGKLVTASFDETVELITVGNKTCFSSNGNNFIIDADGTVTATEDYIRYGEEVSEMFVINEINPEKVVVIIDDGGSRWQ